MKKMTDIKIFSSTLIILLSIPFIIITPSRLNAQEQGKKKEAEVSVASFIPQKISEAPGIVSVITAEEIEAMGARDLRDVLRLVPGFQMAMSDFGFTQVDIRSAATHEKSEKVKILIDQMPVNDHIDGASTAIFSELPVDNIARIEIIRGPASSLYGAKAFTGVISIITKKAEGIDGFDFTLKGGGFKTKETGFLFGKRFNHFKLKAYFNYYDTGGQEIPIEEDGLFTDPLPYNRTISLAGTDRGHTLEGIKKLNASLNLSYKNFYFKSFFTEYEKNHYYYLYGAIGEDSVSWNSQLNGMIGYKLTLNEDIRIEPRLYSILYKSENLWQLYPPGYMDIYSFEIYPHGQYNLEATKEKVFGADIKLKYKISYSNTLNLGLSYEYVKLINDAYYSNIGSPELTKDNLAEVSGTMKMDPSRKIFSAFIQDQWNVSNSITLTAGLRYDNYNDAGSTVNPRFALVWKPVRKAAFKLLYGQAFRPPTFVELHLFILGGFVTGSVYNKPETVKTLELEFSYHLTDSIHFNLDCFHVSLNDLIYMHELWNEEEVYHVEYRNSDSETLVQGIEAQMKVLFGRNNYGFINYCYKDGEDKKTGDKMPGIAHHTLNAGLNLELFSNLNFNIVANMVGPRERRARDQREKLKGYTLVDATLMGKGPVKNMKLFLSVYNLFNSDCRIPHYEGYLTNDFPLPNSARSFYLGLKYSF